MQSWNNSVVHETVYITALKCKPLAHTVWLQIFVVQNSRDIVMNVIKKLWQLQFFRDYCYSTTLSLCAQFLHGALGCTGKCEENSKMTHLEFQSWIRGFINPSGPLMGETHSCSQETSNLHNPFVVKILKTDEIVEHFQKRISSTFSIIILTITCTVNGERRYSRDLT